MNDDQSEQWDFNIDSGAADLHVLRFTLNNLGPVRSYPIKAPVSGITTAHSRTRRPNIHQSVRKTLHKLYMPQGGRR